MIHQLDIYGKDLVETSIQRIKAFEPKEGYYLAFSGGKDSVVCKALCDMAGVKYDAHYNVTSVDPPELVRFIKREYPDVHFDVRHWECDGRRVKEGDPVTMWNLIPEKRMPPTRLARYCCAYLKEEGGHGRKIITGVRWAESTNRKQNAAVVRFSSNIKTVEKVAEEVGADIFTTSKGGVILNNDNAETRELVETCYMQAKTTINPIIDWTDDEVWEFIREYNVPYCELYDQGFKRLGCIGCPMGGSKSMTKEFERYPKYKDLYLKAFERMLELNKQSRREATWKTAQEVFDWWLGI